ncbi:zinc finger BED domain-containing protein 1-like isoform X2 [Salarias fasciatus]|uniref:zinc finger BED domain-containing protein 1-like isoform X2 n=1 Tax=Salarias fasciatus TaxID=181472 RepID=UPI00117666E0|nr:zinc finger BED domain-containing protein 1-like isoform X2 [Salarias fasciatus]
MCHFCTSTPVGGAVESLCCVARCHFGSRGSHRGRSGLTENPNMASKLTTPPQYKADVWKYFGFQLKGGKNDLDKDNAVCKICLALVKYCGNTTNLRAHLARHHAEVLAEKQPQKRIEPNQTTVDALLPSNSPRAQRITEAVVHFICKDLRPYSVVDNVGFRWMLHTLEPRYRIPQRVHITETAVPKMYEEVKTAVKTSLSTAQRVALTCDGWTSRATESYITITSHYISDNWEMVTHVLQTRAMHESHTGSNIADVLKKAIEEWGLQDKDPAIVTDNASNMTVAAELASMLHFKCFAHTLNLASQRALKLPAVQRLLGKVRRITNFFRRSTIASHVLKEKQKLLNLEQHKLKTDVVTRWNSAHDMLQRFLKQQPAITAALLSNEVRKNEKDISTLTEADIGAAEEIVRAMKPMKAATIVMEEEKTPTLSAVAPIHAQLIEKLQESPGDSNMSKEIKSAICQDLGRRHLDEQQRQTLHVCAALDPRFKTLPFLSEDEQKAVYDRVVTEAARTQGLFQRGAGENESEPWESETRADGNEDAGLEVPDEEDEGSSQGPGEEENTAAQSTSKKRSRDSCGLAELLGQTYASGSAKKLKTTDKQAQEEMGRYKETAPMPITKGANPLNWWKEHECEYPLLSNLAKRYLCIPGTSVSSERVFSTAGDIITAQRSTLSPEHLDQILFLQKNLKTKEVKYKH